MTNSKLLWFIVSFLFVSVLVAFIASTIAFIYTKSYFSFSILSAIPLVLGILKHIVRSVSPLPEGEIQIELARIEHKNTIHLSGIRSKPTSSPETIIFTDVSPPISKPIIPSQKKRPQLKEKILPDEDTDRTT